MQHVDELLKVLPTAELAGASWRDFGEVAVVRDLDAAYALADEYASEHVQILTREPREALQKMRNYGALFLGERTCVSYGDKVSLSLFFPFGFPFPSGSIFIVSMETNSKCSDIIPFQCIGTNHVLPTRGAARYTGGLWVGKFLKTVTYQEVVEGKASGELGRLCGRAARAERFEGHARSGDLRAKLYLGDEFEWISKTADGEVVGEVQKSNGV